MLPIRTKILGQTAPTIIKSANCCFQACTTFSTKAQKNLGNRQDTGNVSNFEQLKLNFIFEVLFLFYKDVKYIK